MTSSFLRSSFLNLTVEATFCATRPRFCAALIRVFKLVSTLRAVARLIPPRNSSSEKSVTAGIVSRASLIFPDRRGRDMVDVRLVLLPRRTLHLTLLDQQRA